MGKFKGDTGKSFKKAGKKTSIKSKFIENNKNNKWKSKSNQKKKEKKMFAMEEESIEVEKVIPLKNISENDSTSSKRKSSIIKEHQDELKGLEETDPEFYKYLQENDSNLLTFGEDDDDNDDDDDGIDYYENDLDNISDTNEDDININKSINKKKLKNVQKSIESIEVTEDLINTLISRSLSKGGSTNSLKKLLTIFRSACIPLNNVNNDDENGYNISVTSKYLINTPEIYEYVMTHIMDNTHTALYKLLECKELKTTDDIKNLEKNSKWKQVQMLVLSYMKSILHTLEGLLESTQGQVAVLVISSLEKYIPFIGLLPRISKPLLKILLNFWSKDIPIADDIYNVKGHAFLRIRQMAITLPGTFTEECFRSIYLTYARNSKSFNELSSSTNVIFMSQCIVELYNEDIVMAYQQAFLYIRQLALHLRMAIVKTSSTSLRLVTNWQFLNCIRLWTRVLCAMPNSNQLGSLIFPLTQIILGIISLINSLYYIPLKYHLITCLHQLIAHSNTYIPILTKIIEIFDNKDYFISKSIPSTDIPPNFIYLIKLTNNTINYNITKDTIILQTINLIRHNIEILRYNVSLPEYCYILIKKIKNFIKLIKFNKWINLLKVLLNTIESYCNYIKIHRNELLLKYIPSHITEFEMLLPIGEPIAKIRLNQLLSLNSLSNPLSIISINIPINNEMKKDEDKEIEKKKINDKKKKNKKKNNITSDIDSNDKIILDDNVEPLEWSDDEN